MFYSMSKGDQLFVHRELINLQGMYEHHGIDCGDGTVIHYRKPSETIERTSILTF
jgi:Lecithin retinol acyltransferase